VKLKLIYHLLAGLIICLVSTIGFSQNKVRLAYVLTTNDANKLTTDTAATFLNIKLAKAHVIKQHQQLLTEGYFEASVDSITNNEEQLTAFLNIGPKYNGINLNISTLPMVLKEQLNLPKTLDSITLSLNKWQAITTQILKHAENNGHPFAAITLTDIYIKNNNISAVIKYMPRQTIKFDSLFVKGNAKLNAVFLQNLFDVKQGDIFKATKLNEINKIIEAQPYLDQYRQPAVEFMSSGANVLLFVNDKKANQFDFVIGLLPQSDGIKLTGEGQFTLHNTFGFGERLHLNYTNLPNSGRQLAIETKATYLPYLPFGLDANFNLYIQDTSFISRNFKIGILYPFKANNFVEVYFANEQSNLLEINAEHIVETKQLPQNLDWATNSYGLRLHIENYNYRFNPTKGYGIDFAASLGNRNIIKNNRIIDLKDATDLAYNFELLYDSLTLKTAKLQLNGKLEKFFPIKKNATLKTMLSFAYFYTSGSFKSVYENELYRIGGLHTLRGFDEASILGNFYSILTVEYRYLIARQSFFSFFANSAFIENQQMKLLNKTYSQLFYSVGLGLNFETSSGIFSLNYALGKQQYNNISFKAGKIHFGYLNVF